MSGLWQDLRYALRSLARTPVFTGVALVSLALGIGGNSAVFSLMDQTLLRALPIKHPEQIVLFSSPGMRAGWMQSNYSDTYAFSYPEYREFRDHTSGFSGIVARYSTFVTMNWKGQTDRIYGEMVSGNYFETLGTRAAIGRTLTPDDDRVPGQQPVVVLNYDFWARRFGRDPSVLNRTVDINAHPMTVVGVAQKGFHGLGTGEAPDFYVPMMMRAQVSPGQEGLDNISAMWLNIFARVSSPGVANASANSVWHSLREREAKELTVKMSAARRTQWANQALLLTPGGKGISGAPDGLASGMAAMMAMVGLLLLIACANVANLLIARASGRQREIAVRFALGASRLRIIRQLLVESILLSVVGGAAGLLVAVWTSASLLRLVPPGFTTDGLTSSLDGRVLLFALVLTLVCGVLFGLAPALQGSRRELATTLKDQASGVVGGFGHVRARKLLVASQVALSLLLLIGAGLFARSLYNLKSIDPGFRPPSLLQFSIEPSLSGYTNAKSLELYRRLWQQVSALPGVLSVSGASSPVLSGDLDMSGISIEGYTPKEDENMTTRINAVGPRYFGTMGIPLLLGRDFQPGDDETAAKVVVINESFAAKYLSARNPIGQRLSLYEERKKLFEVVGVVRDSKHQNLREKATPFVYFPYLQQPVPALTFYVRARQDPTSLASAVRGVLKQADPNLPLYDLKTVDHQIDELLFTDRFVAFLSTAFGVLATLLAAIGLYGVMAYMVVRRTREIGIRVALGARPGMVVRMVMREVLAFAAGGIAVALLAAIALARVVNSQLFSVSKFDPLVFAGATLAIALTAALAGYLPASRAARVDPLTALRYE